jgi:hypothetical protein
MRRLLVGSIIGIVLASALLVMSGTHYASALKVQTKSGTFASTNAFGGKPGADAVGGLIGAGADILNGHPRAIKPGLVYSGCNYIPYLCERGVCSIIFHSTQY